MYKEIDFQEKEFGEQKLFSYKIVNSVKIDSVEVEMLKNNKIKGLLPFSTVQNNDDIDFMYEKTHKITLAQFLGGIVRWEDLLSAIKKIVETINDCEQYMLNENHFVLDANAIFVDLNTRKPEMIFLPVEDDLAAKTSWKEFLLLLLQNLNYDERDDVTKFDRLSSFLADDKITVKQYLEKLKSLEIPSVQSQKVQKQEKIVKEIVPQKKIKDNVIYNVPSSKEKPDTDVVKTQMDTKKDNKFSLFSKKKKKEKKKQNSPKKEESFAFDIPGQKRASSTGRKKEINGVQEIEETVLDETGGISLFMPYLVRKATNQQIPINKKDFKIGREEKYVDYVTSEPTVGRLHASIVLDEQGKSVFVRDANSKNGTFVNGIKIQSNINVPVEEGTIIRFGRDEYVVQFR